MSLPLLFALTLAAGSLPSAWMRQNQTAWLAWFGSGMLISLLSDLALPGNYAQHRPLAPSSGHRGNCSLGLETWVSCSLFFPTENLLHHFPFDFLI